MPAHHRLVWNRDIEVLSEVSVPHKADIGQKEAAQVPLI